MSPSRSRFHLEDQGFTLQIKVSPRGLEFHLADQSFVELIRILPGRSGFHLMDPDCTKRIYFRHLRNYEDRRFAEPFPEKLTIHHSIKKLSANIFQIQCTHIHQFCQLQQINVSPVIHLSHLVI